MDANVERPGTKTRGAERHRGAPISPLLSNLYMRRFILAWKVLGHENRLQAKIVNYADDFVICCRRSADTAMNAMRSIMQKLKLTVNEEKTHICRFPDGVVRLSGLYVRSTLLAKDGSEANHPTSVQEEDSGDLSPNQRDDQQSVEPTRCGGASGSAQPYHGWLGELLLPRSRWATVPHCDRTCLPSAPSVAAG